MRSMLGILAICLFSLGCGGSTAPPQHFIFVTPESGQVLAGGTLQFAASVEPAGSDQAVTWKVGGVGDISPAGLYQAPSPSGNADADLVVTVTATSSTHGVSASARVTIPSAAFLVSRGWEAFAADDLIEALDGFQAALLTVAGYGPAVAGLGWVEFRNGEAEEARSRWEDLEENPSALAGMVLVHASAGEHREVMEAGKALLFIDSSYVFPGDSEYSAPDIRWLVARSALDVGDYAETAAQLDVLSPGHGLNPQAASFPEQALALLESLQGIV